MIAKTEGIVLNSRKYGETSKIVSIYTKDYGKLSLMAKGARKPKNKFGSSLDPLSYSNINFYYKPNRDLHLLSESEHIIPFRRIHESYIHLSAGLLIAEAISQTTVTNEVNISLFKSAVDSLSVLNDITNNPFFISTLFQYKLAEILGFALDFSIMDNFEANTENFYFSLEDGSLTEETNGNNLYLLDKKIAKLLKTISECFMAQLTDSNNSTDKNIINPALISVKDVKSIQEFYADYFSFHLDKRIKFKTMNLLKTQL